MKRSFLERRVRSERTGTSLALLLGYMAWMGGLVANSPSNLIVIFSDDVGYGDLPCYGSDKVPSPHIDRLAVEGMRFTNFHVRGIDQRSTGLGQPQECMPEPPVQSGPLR